MLYESIRIQQYDALAEGREAMGGILPTDQNVQRAKAQDAWEAAPASQERS